MATRIKPTGRIPTKGPTFFFWYGLSCATGLLLLAFWYSWAYQAERCLAELVCVRFSGIDPVGGLLPLGVPWFGALGGVTISLYGVFDHNDDWDPRWNYWHLARPILGALLATVAFFIFYVLIAAAGEPPAIDDAEGENRIVLYVLAFLVGYRESTFKELIKRVSDVILKPADADGAQTGASDDAAGEVDGDVDGDVVESEDQPVLKRGSRGEAVRRLQRGLKEAGLRAGTDGRFGPKTEEAVRAFQEARSLPVDGVVGPATWSALEPPD